MTRELTGRHVLIIALSAFGLIIAANLSMLFAATGTFPGLVVKNAYVASQGWNARTDAQRALGWQVEAAYGHGVLRLDLTDRAGQPVSTDLHLIIGRPTTDRDDQELQLSVLDGAATAPVTLASGVWRIEIKAADDSFQTAARIQVKDAP